MTEDDGYETIVPDLSAAPAMTPIERAARALWDLHPLTEDGAPTPWERVDNGIKNDLAEEARAVLQAIPIDDLVEDAFLAVMNANDRELALSLSDWAGRNLLKRRIRAALHGMIDAALNEQP